MIDVVRAHAAVRADVRIGASNSKLEGIQSGAMAGTELGQSAASCTGKRFFARVNASTRVRGAQDTIGGERGDGVIDDFSVDPVEHLPASAGADHPVLQEWPDRVNTLRAKGMFEFPVAGRRRSADEVM